MSYDVIIIGAGFGGYSAALRSAKHGAKVALIEKDEVGGVCLNRGCIPTKTLLKTALVYREIKRSSFYGIDIEKAVLNFDKVMERKNKVVKILRSGINLKLKESGVEIIKGTAKITGIHRVTVGNIDLKAENIIIAVGSKPAKPRIKGIDDNTVIYSDQALVLEQVPDSLVIIGGGVIGLEFAVLYSEFGSKICIIEMQDTILPTFDKEIAIEMTKILERAGIEVITSAKVKSIENGMIYFEKDNEIYQRRGDKILVSVGREPNTLGLFSVDLGIEMENGFVMTDTRQQTSVDNIFAVGDVNGRDMLAHVAYAEGLVAADNALGIKTEMSYKAVPKCLYTFPEVASVGISEEEAHKKALEIRVGKYPVRANGRALADGNIEGFAKIITDKISGKILGVHLIAPHATEMITGGVMAVDFEIKDFELTRLIHPHPTISEIVLEACLNTFDS